MLTDDIAYIQYNYIFNSYSMLQIINEQKNVNITTNHKGNCNL